MIYKASENYHILPSDRSLITDNNNICYVKITGKNSFHIPRGRGLLNISVLRRIYNEKIFLF
jgi:hypothetical protein